VYVDTILGPDEYFYKRQPTVTSNADESHASTDSAMSSDEERIGEPDEFEQMIKRHHNKQKH
jgi:hypothetical protein